LESKIYRLSEIVGQQRNATIENVQRKQARTTEEREEDEDEIVNDDDSENEDEEVVYNPKNLPLGWDGKVSLKILKI
jgi:splicing factor 3A subunit 3